MSDKYDGILKLGNVAAPRNVADFLDGVESLALQHDLAAVTIVAFAQEALHMTAFGEGASFRRARWVLAEFKILLQMAQPGGHA